MTILPKTHPQRLDEVHVHIDFWFVSEEDQPVVGPAEAVLDPNADGEVPVTDVVDIQQPHGEVDEEGAAPSRLRPVHLVVVRGETDRAAAELLGTAEGGEGQEQDQPQHCHHTGTLSFVIVRWGSNKENYNK